LMLIALSLVIIYDLNFPSRAFAPLKAYPPLIVDPDAVLSAPIAAQRFKAVSRRSPQIIELFGRVDGQKLGSRPPLNLVRDILDQIAGKQCCRSLVGKAFDHDRGAYRKSVRKSS